MTRLEAHLDVRLMHRTMRSLALIAEGELLYARSARILDDERAPTEQVRDDVTADIESLTTEAIVPACSQNGRRDVTGINPICAK